MNTRMGRDQKERSPPKTTGLPTAQGWYCLWLLRFRPDPVRSQPLHRTRPSLGTTVELSLAESIRASAAFVKPYTGRIVRMRGMDPGTGQNARFATTRWT